MQADRSCWNQLSPYLTSTSCCSIKLHQPDTSSKTQGQAGASTPPHHRLNQQSKRYGILLRTS